MQVSYRIRYLPYTDLAWKGADRTTSAANSIQAVVAEGQPITLPSTVANNNGLIMLNPTLRVVVSISADEALARPFLPHIYARYLPSQNISKTREAGTQLRGAVQATRDTFGNAFSNCTEISARVLLAGDNCVAYQFIRCNTEIEVVRRLCREIHAAVSLSFTYTSTRLAEQAGEITETDRLTAEQQLAVDASIGIAVLSGKPV